MKKTSIKKKYDLSAEVYDSRYENIQFEKYYLMLSNHVLKGRALDLGCGTGLLQKFLTKKLIGSDISFKMLKKAKERGEFVVQADLDYLPFKDNSFQEIFSFTALQNLPNIKLTLQEAKRLLKKDGIFILTILKKSLSPSFHEYLKKYFEIQEINDVGEDAGFILSSNK